MKARAVAGLAAVRISVVSEVAQFATGAAPIRQLDRVLVTVLFTDIVDSTRQAGSRSAWASTPARSSWSSRGSGVSQSTSGHVWPGGRSGEVLVTSTVRDLVAGSGIDFEERGDHVLKGVPGSWRLLSAVPT